MAAPGASLQLLNGVTTCHTYTNFRSSSLFSFKYCLKTINEEYCERISRKGQALFRNRVGNHVFGREGKDYRLNSLHCKCSRNEIVKETFAEQGNDVLLNGVGNDLDPKYSNGHTTSAFGATSIDDEAWTLLRASMVYYWGNPVGTIAANDSSDSNMLNYDQVFIRDFIPSGIAFLLKGEYEIVRNFILNTLQLQSWEKTMDCHSPGQGLMPASFKVRTVPLDGEDSATEEVLDPDFGEEAAIGRVAPVDSGLWWIILLRAYGKCTGDLSVQERIDVQTGIKMILKLCLADGFDMFPTLLVTDGSCMIDRRMGIHGHPLEI